MKDNKPLFLEEERPLIELPVVIWLVILMCSLAAGLSLLVFPWWLVLAVFCVACMGIVVFLNPLFGVIIFLFGAFLHPTQHFPQLQQFDLAQNLAVGVLLVWGFRTIVHRDFNFVKSKENFLLILYLALVIISGIKSWDFSS
ncbi:MAG: hypothetical protein ABIH09_04000, partial [Candidatus Omnitrophota bacterium]